MEFSDKKVGERISVGIDFVRLLKGGEIIASATASLSVLDGTDPTPAALLDGAAAIDGTTVWQVLQGGVADTYYTIEFTVVTTAPHTYIERASIKVIA